MKICLPFVAAALVVLGMATAGRSAPTPPLVSTAIGSALAARLRAVNIDPNDPRLFERLAERRESQIRRRHTPSIALHAVGRPPITLLHSAQTKTTLSVDPSAATRTFDLGAANATATRKPVVGALFVPPDGAVAFLVEGTWLEKTAHVVGKLGACIAFDETVPILPYDGSSLVMLSQGYAVDQAAGRATIAIGNAVSDPYTFTYTSQVKSWGQEGVVISSDGAPKTDAGVPVTPDITFWTDRPGGRYLSSAPPMGGSGIDTIGAGVTLLNGWKAKAEIGWVSSGLDTPASPTGSDGYRSATIVQQPESGRLETRVKWSYAPGDSLAYYIVWTFTNGKAATRYDDALPKTSTCPSLES